jgi:hypothetical protein
VCLLQRGEGGKIQITHQIAVAALEATSIMSAVAKTRSSAQSSRGAGKKKARTVAAEKASLTAAERFTAGATDSALLNLPALLLPVVLGYCDVPDLCRLGGVSR